MIYLSSNAEEIKADLMARLTEYQKNISSKVFDALTLLEVDILQNIKSRSGLHVRSGTLLNSISGSKKVGLDSNGNIVGEIGPEGVPYAAAHEFGVITKPHDILPRAGKALHFMQGNKEVFAKIVHHPGSNIPARPYLQPALANNQEQILKDFGLFLSMTFKTEEG